MSWKSYRYRFLPWILQNFKSQCIRVTKQDQFLVESDAIIGQLLAVCELLVDCLGAAKYEKFLSQELFEGTHQTFRSNFGFSVARQASLLKDGGLGVVVSEGTVPIHHIVGIYPGTVYRAGEPIFFQSIANAFLFRCSDGTMIDGNDRALSKMIYRSCCFRDRAGPRLTGDMTWLTGQLANPLSVGQYVNNCTNNSPANVTYQEVDIPLADFHPNMRRFIPNVPYSPNAECVMHLRMVVLVSLREINEHEELYSNYFTLIT